MRRAHLAGNLRPVPRPFQRATQRRVAKPVGGARYRAAILPPRPICEPILARAYKRARECLDLLIKIGVVRVSAFNVRLRKIASRVIDRYTLIELMEKGGIRTLDPGIMSPVLGKSSRNFNHLPRGRPLQLAPRSTTDSRKFPAGIGW